MSYLTDNPFPLMLLLVAVAVVAFLSGSAKGRGIAGICVLAAVGVFFLERYLVSPAEGVEITIEEMLQNFKDRNVPGIVGQISSESQSLADVAKNGLELVDISDSFHLKSCEVTIHDDDKSATARIRANGTITLRKRGGGGQHVPTMWDTTWIMEQGQWKMAAYERLNPATGEKIGVFSSN